MALSDYISALSDAKPLRTFAGNALSLRIVRRKTAEHFCWKCSVFTHCPTQNRGALLLEMLVSWRIILRKTAAHFCWKCLYPGALSYENRCALSLEMLLS